MAGHVTVDFCPRASGLSSGVGQSPYASMIHVQSLMGKENQHSSTVHTCYTAGASDRSYPVDAFGTSPLLVATISQEWKEFLTTTGRL